MGRKLAAKLLGQGYEVIGADLRSCEELEGREGYRFQELDLTKWESVERLDLSRLDHIVHLAAAGVKAAGRTWPICVRVNVEGTANLVRKLLVDSCEFSGQNSGHSRLSTNNQKLSTTKIAPLFLYTKTWYEDHLDECQAFRESPYVVSKAASTHWVETLAETYPGPVVIAKVFQVYGPGDDPNNVLSYAARCIKNGEPATFGSGTQLRDWIYIDDFIDGLVACLSCATPGLTHYDLGTGQTHTLREIIDQLAAIVNSCQLVGKSTLSTNNYQLTFDPTKDRGDTKITDQAQTAPPDWRPAFTVEKSLSNLLTS